MKNGQRSRIRILEAQLRDLRVEEEDMRREIAEGEAIRQSLKKWLAAAAVLVALISQSSNT